ncbi:hypothetical protein [Ruminococcus flavefaciens]|uniref:Uncharacterized protein n=1 Tax=Ruminococcus flavefaciens TaxID=1265 RepID=A0A315XYK4_RUMFL|nr:hypothetical protein [Ruminococcus flavefaciens]PWJ12276.1 hypothetical protein IE37_01967 [Ruminococcus flavefaciens]SSA49766.1 hypothetical protein SAMN02910325_01967 [Ruminococcus flavefaciens]
MNYKELLYNMMDESRGDAERYLSGDKADYLSCRDSRQLCTEQRLFTDGSGHSFRL